MDAAIPRDRHPSQRWLERLAVRILLKLRTDELIQPLELSDAQLFVVERWIRWTILDEAAAMREQDRTT